jgi:hypothetical protein
MIDFKNEILNKQKYESDIKDITKEVISENLKMIKHIFKDTGVTVGIMISDDDVCTLRLQYSGHGYGFNYYDVIENSIPAEKLKIEMSLLNLISFIVSEYDIKINQEEYIEKRYTYTFDSNEFFDNKIIIRFTDESDLIKFINYIMKNYDIKDSLTNILSIYKHFIKGDIKDYGLRGSLFKNNRFTIVDIVDLNGMNDERHIFNFEDIKFEGMDDN